jgi:hypothetical protein
MMNSARPSKSATASTTVSHDLTRMHSCAFSLVVNQALMVLLAYTLVQAHLVLRQRQQLITAFGNAPGNFSRPPRKW